MLHFLSWRGDAYLHICFKSGHVPNPGYPETIECTSGTQAKTRNWIRRKIFGVTYRDFWMKRRTTACTLSWSKSCIALVYGIVIGYTIYDMRYRGLGLRLGLEYHLFISAMD